MNTLLKIAAIFIIAIGLSAPTYAADQVAADQADNGTLTFPGANSGGPLVFTPSANTLLAAASDATTYNIASASSKTDANNGMQYGMTQDFNGYYQTSGGGEAPTLDFTEWTKMGGGS